MLVCSAFIFCRVLTLIRYIEVEFTFGLRDYVCYIARVSLYRGSLYRGCFPYILLQLAMCSCCRAGKGEGRVPFTSVLNYSI